MLLRKRFSLSAETRWYDINGGRVATFIIRAIGRYKFPTSNMCALILKKIMCVLSIVAPCWCTMR